MASSVGDVVGKLVVGYQGWFGCIGDGSPFNSSRHWSPSGPPAPGNLSFELYPDLREYTTTYNTGFANLGNGQPAKLFSDWNDQTVATHFKWMQDYEIDCAAIQRFGLAFSTDARALNFYNGVMAKCKTQAEAFGRKFYVMYDISGWTNFQTEIKADWTNLMQTYTSSTAYAKQNGKPVVCIWGPGVSGRPGDVNSWSDVISWFKAQGCYVIVGTPRNWRSQTVNLPAYNLADMITPWTVGSFGDQTGADTYATVMQDDLTYLNARGQDYQPVCFPGFAWSNWNGGNPNQIPRKHGDFMWRQFANIRSKNITNAYIAMFDEYDEATAIAKAAENSSMIPTNQYFLTLDADGVAVSSDFYLRLTNDGAKMIKGLTPLSWSHPTTHQLNSFALLDNCDATTGWTAGANSLTLNTVDKKEGSGALQALGSGTEEFRKIFSSVNTGASVTNGSISFWYYVSDASQFASNNQIELGSGGAPDVNEYSWNIGPLNNGWNFIIKSFSTAGITGGTPNLNAINWFRIYHSKTAAITTRIDDIKIIY